MTDAKTNAAAMTDKDSMDFIGTVMSNSDGAIDEDIASQLKDNPMKVHAQYSGWDFCGYVWFNGEEYVCQVWVYGSPKEEIQAGELEDIMSKVCDKYGSA